VRDLLKGDLKALYGQAKFYRTLGDKGIPFYLFRALRQWAMDNNLPEARFDYMQDQFLEGNLSSGWTYMRMLTDRGYPPAMMEAARRYLEGDGVDKNRGKAYYWLNGAVSRAGMSHRFLKHPTNAYS
jgi:TPR repeat protein